jgi:hypothetical protein
LTKQLRDARTLDEEAAAIRERARALHDASKNDIHKENTSWGARHDTMKQEATAARSRAVEADKQANDLYAESNRYAETAGEHDAYGAQINADRPVEAEEYFEEAQGWVRMAEATSARAEAAREVAREWATKADELEQNLQSIDGEPMSPGYRAPQLERAADLLDDKARLLGEAAQKQRDSEAEYAADEPGAGSASHNWARYAQEQADAIEPDYSAIDPAALMDAGVPRSEIPGSELMDPTYDESVSYDESASSYDGDAYADAGTFDAAAAGDMSLEYES